MSLIFWREKHEQRCTVRVPATTANLACGFDTLGCALSLYNTLSFTRPTVCPSPAAMKSSRPPDNLACQGFDAVYARLGRPAPAVHIDIRADIPVCRGLGSSAAMLAAGAMAANALSGAKLSKAELLSIITPIEGHPDNLAPALFGGLVASTSRDGKVYSAHYPVHESLHFVVLSPIILSAPIRPAPLCRQAFPLPMQSLTFRISPCCRMLSPSAMRR